MDRRGFLSGALALFAAPLAVDAQQTGKVYRIGFLGNSTAALETNLVDPFREGLRDLGCVEGQTVVIVYRWAEGKYERLPAWHDGTRELVFEPLEFLEQRRR